MVDEKIEKKMIHIVMDTSGIGLNRSFKRVSFKTLEKLVEMGHISIHIPYIVRREFETQQYEYYLNKYDTAFKAISLR